MRVSEIYPVSKSLMQEYLRKWGYKPVALRTPRIGEYYVPIFLDDTGLRWGIVSIPPRKWIYERSQAPILLIVGKEIYERALQRNTNTYPGCPPWDTSGAYGSIRTHTELSA